MSSSSYIVWLRSFYRPRAFQTCKEAPHEVRALFDKM